MAHTFVEFDNDLVFVHEHALACAVAIIWHEAGNDASNCFKADKEYAEWIERVNNSGNGCLKLPLDAMLGSDPKKKQEFLCLLSVAEQRTRSFGDIVPGEYIDAVADVPNELKGGMSAHRLLEVLQDLRDLITKKKGGKWVSKNKDCPD